MMCFYVERLGSTADFCPATAVRGGGGPPQGGTLGRTPLFVGGARFAAPLMSLVVVENGCIFRHRHSKSPCQNNHFYRERTFVSRYRGDDVLFDNSYPKTIPRSPTVEAVKCLVLHGEDR